MTILGFDISMSCTGWAIIERDKLAAYGSIPNNLKKDKQHLDALKNLYEAVQRIPSSVRLEGDYKIDAVGSERYFAFKRAGLGAVYQAQGVVKLWIAQQGFKFYEFTPQQVKLASTGSGRAEKGAVQRMVAALYPAMKYEKNDNITDAVAVAIATQSQLAQDRRTKIEN